VGPDAQVGVAAVRVHGAEHVDPQFHVLALQAADGAAILVAQSGEVAVLHADDIGASHREVDVEIDELTERWASCPAAVTRRPPASRSALARRRMAPRSARCCRSDGRRRAADADGRAELFEAHAVEPVLGEQACCRLHECVRTLRLGALARGARCPGVRCHSS
jgi:hypothetical protein